MGLSPILIELALPWPNTYCAVQPVPCSNGGVVTITLPDNSTASVRLSNRNYPVSITHHELPLLGLPKDLVGATIAHITDLHCGYGDTDAVYSWLEREVNRLNPVSILFTGDYVDDHYQGSGYPLGSLLARVKCNRTAVAVYGNHDHRRKLTEATNGLADAQIRLLVNEGVELLPGLWAAGVDDIYEGNPDLDRTLAALPHDRTSLLLSHNPSAIEKLAKSNVVVFSGHTHGAQMRLPFPSPELVCRIHLHCNQVMGWYNHGLARLYISRGIGVTGLPPIRLACPAELAMFHLTAGKGTFSPSSVGKPVR